MKKIATIVLLSAGILLSLTGCQKGTTTGKGKERIYGIRIGAPQEDAE